MPSGGKRDHTGRSVSHEYKLQCSVSKSFYTYRTLLGLDRATLRTGKWSPRDPTMFMAVITFVFVVTRLLGGIYPGEPIDWGAVTLDIGLKDKKKKQWCFDCTALIHARWLAMGARS